MALFGGVYSNHLALHATLADAERAGARAVYCLGDLGAFGPHPDRTCEIIRSAGIPTVQGNYDHSIGHELDDCRCGYTDPRDNHFAALSYRYTYANTGRDHRAWMRTLPAAIRFEMSSEADARRVVLYHGSPRRTNEFLWESACSDHFLEYLLDLARADVLCVSHTGLPWTRALRDGRRVVNVGAIGRPANDGRPGAVYALLREHGRHAIDVEWRRVSYDHGRLAGEVRAEGLPEEFAETIETGWWTTCLEVLPFKERARGRY